jgi:hypothetical protein
MEIANDIWEPTTRPDSSGGQHRLSLGSQEMGRATPLKIIDPNGYACSFADSLYEIGQIFPGESSGSTQKGPRKQRDRSIFLRSFRRMAKKSKPRKSEPIILARC